MNHFSEPRVDEGKWDSRVVRRARRSAFVGVVRDILGKMRDVKLLIDAGMAVSCFVCELKDVLTIVEVGLRSTVSIAHLAYLPIQRR